MTQIELFEAVDALQMAAPELRFTTLVIPTFLARAMEQWARKEEVGDLSEEFLEKGVQVLNGTKFGPFIIRVDASAKAIRLE